MWGCFGIKQGNLQKVGVQKDGTEINEDILCEKDKESKDTSVSGT